MKMRISISFVLLCGLLAGCSSTLTTDGVEGVIFPAHKADFVAQATGRKELAYWTPSEPDIVHAIPHIRKFLSGAAPTIANRLQQYRCQYFGIIVNGKKGIYCNFFHRDGHDENWRTEPLFVLDGGDWYFQLEYEVEKKQCLKFRVNGEA